MSEISDRGCQSPAEAMYCELDLSMKKNISTEDKLVSCEVNLQECKQARDPLSPVQLLEPKQTKDPAVQVNDTAIDDKEKSCRFKVSLDFFCCIFMVNSKTD